MVFCASKKTTKNVTRTCSAVAGRRIKRRSGDAVILDNFKEAIMYPVHVRKNKSPLYELAFFSAKKGCRVPHDFNLSPKKMKDCPSITLMMPKGDNLIEMGVKFLSMIDSTDSPSTSSQQEIYGQETSIIKYSGEKSTLTMVPVINVNRLEDDNIEVKTERPIISLDISKNNSTPAADETAEKGKCVPCECVSGKNSSNTSASVESTKELIDVMDGTWPILDQDWFEKNILSLSKDDLSNVNPTDNIFGEQCTSQPNATITTDNSSDQGRSDPIVNIVHPTVHTPMVDNSDHSQVSANRNTTQFGVVPAMVDNSNYNYVGSVDNQNISQSGIASAMVDNSNYNYVGSVENQNIMPTMASGFDHIVTGGDQNQFTYYSNVSGFDCISQSQQNYHSPGQNIGNNFNSPTGMNSSMQPNNYNPVVGIDNSPATARYVTQDVWMDSVSSTTDPNPLMSNQLNTFNLPQNDINCPNLPGINLDPPVSFEELFNLQDYLRFN